MRRHVRSNSGSSRTNANRHQPGTDMNKICAAVALLQVLAGCTAQHPPLLRDDLPNGEGTFTDSDGEAVRGLWQDGCLRSGDQRAWMLTTPARSPAASTTGNP